MIDNYINLTVLRITEDKNYDDFKYSDKIEIVRNRLALDLNVNPDEIQIFYID